jgi:hypothetical protein
MARFRERGIQVASPKIDADQPAVINRRAPVRLHRSHRLVFRSLDAHVRLRSPCSLLALGLLSDEELGLLLRRRQQQWIGT